MLVRDRKPSRAVWVHLIIAALIISSIPLLISCGSPSSLGGWMLLLGVGAPLTVALDILVEFALELAGGWLLRPESLVGVPKALLVAGLTVALCLSWAGWIVLGKLFPHPP